jgi:hypothetical protein
MQMRQGSYEDRKENGQWKVRGCDFYLASRHLMSSTSIWIPFPRKLTLLNECNCLKGEGASKEVMKHQFSLYLANRLC